MLNLYTTDVHLRGAPVGWVNAPVAAVLGIALPSLLCACQSDATGKRMARVGDAGVSAPTSNDSGMYLDRRSSTGDAANGAAFDARADGTSAVVSPDTGVMDGAPSVDAAVAADGAVVTDGGSNADSAVSTDGGSGAVSDGGSDVTPPTPCIDGERRDTTVSCGLNQRGFVYELCVAGTWQTECQDPDVCVDGTERLQTPCPTGSGNLHETCVAGAWQGSDCIDCAYPIIAIQRLEMENALYVLRRVGEIETAIVDVATDAASKLMNIVTYGSSRYACPADATRDYIVTSYDGSAGVYEAGRVADYHEYDCATGELLTGYTMTLTENGAVAADLLSQGVVQNAFSEERSAGHDVHLLANVHFAHQQETTTLLDNYSVSHPISRNTLTIGPIGAQGSASIDIDGQSLDVDVTRIFDDDQYTYGQLCSGCGLPLVGIGIVADVATRDVAYRIVDPLTGNALTVVTPEPVILSGPTYPLSLNAAADAWSYTGYRTVTDRDGGQIGLHSGGALAQHWSDTGPPSAPAVWFDPTPANGWADAEGRFLPELWPPVLMSTRHDLPTFDVAWPDAPASCDVQPRWPLLCNAGTADVQCANGHCYDPMTSTTHCGATANCVDPGVLCAAGEICNGGTCTCPGLSCNGSCVDPWTDTGNCGTCGQMCAANELCFDGACQSCGSGELRCGDACTDVSSDPDHCGACNSPCVVGQVCVAGTCATSCPSTTTVCGRFCVDVNSDAANCGACGNACAGGTSCVAGTCSMQWQLPELIGSGDAFSPPVRMDANGNAYVAWAENVASSAYNLRLSRYDATSGTWLPPSLVEASPGGLPVDLAVDPSGNALVTWNNVLQYGFDYVATNGTVTNRAAMASLPSAIAALSNGTGLAVEPYGLDVPQIESKIYDPTLSTWSQASVFATNATLTWARETAGTRNVLVADNNGHATTFLYDASSASFSDTFDVNTGTWSAPEIIPGAELVLDTSDYFGDHFHDIAVSVAGDALVVWWTKMTGISASLKRAGGAWSAATLVTDSAYLDGPWVGAVVSPTGRSFAFWPSHDPVTLEHYVAAATAEPDTFRWSAPVRLPCPNVVPVFGGDDSGSALLVCISSSEVTSYRFDGSRRTWGAAQVTSLPPGVGPGFAPPYASIAVNPADGRAIVTWSTQLSTSIVFDHWAMRFE